MDLPTALSREVKSRLVLRGMSQAELAERIGVSPQVISYRLTSTINWDLETIARVAHGLGLRPRDLVAAAEDAIDSENLANVS